jgi:catechol 2,3-dioxygenase-like lactoylglutathione lyase family enzyme
VVSLKDYRCGASAAVSDMHRARRFYEGVLGLVAGTDTGDNVGYPCAGDTQINVYLSPNAGTAKFTIAGFDVDDIEMVVAQLTDQGVTFEQYDQPPIVTDAQGIAHFEGDAKVAYFNDPDGNILSVAQAPNTTVVTALVDSDVATRLPAQDLDRARRWYSEKLGLDPVEERPGGLRYRCGRTYFVVFQSMGHASGESTQMAWEVDDIEAVVGDLESRGVELEAVDAPGMKTVNGIADIDGNYPSKGRGERGAWFRDSEGNLLAIGQVIR